jgi:hypothetical protein
MARSLGQRMFISGVVGAAFLSFGLSVYIHIRDGRAADTYQNVYGWNIPWTTPATLGAVLFLVALSSWLARWWILWRRSRLEGVPMSQIAKELKRGD